jgi:hypothetical protein
LSSNQTCDEEEMTGECRAYEEPQPGNSILNDSSYHSQGKSKHAEDDYLDDTSLQTS